MSPQDDRAHDDLERRLVAALHRQAATAPDVDEVRRGAAAAGLRRQRRRRRAGAGVALAVVGLGALAVPFADDVVRGARPDEVPAASGPSASGALPAPLPWTVPDDGTWPSSGGAADPEDVEAFLEAGYDYDDAVELAHLWGRPGAVESAKATAGAELRAGLELPITPGSASAGIGPAEAATAYTESGGTVQQALELAELWQLPSGYQAVQKAGLTLLDGGRQLPTTSSEPGAAPLEAARAEEAFYGAGYDVDDAERLAEVWVLDDADEAAVAGGANVLAGQDLPLDP